uniref:Uncharacterized protein n=1 Tax=Aegilops tauschii subsp. strangulata TaxID=200361 RepID=A0A452Y6N4_AEGTS
MFKQTGVLVHTSDDSKWIFVLSTTKAFYVGHVNVLFLYTPLRVCTQFLVKDTIRCIGSDVFFGSGLDDVQKKKGSFQHSSFLAGGAITCAGRLVVKDGILTVLHFFRQYGHTVATTFQRKTTSEISFASRITTASKSSELLQMTRDLFQKSAIDKQDEYPLLSNSETQPEHVENNDAAGAAAQDLTEVEIDGVLTGEAYHGLADHGDMSDAEEDARTPVDSHTTDTEEEEEVNNISEQRPPASVDRSKNHQTCRWSTGTGSRIRCVRDYPQDLQSRALEHVNLSPRLAGSPSRKRDPVPSPRPSPGMILSPRLASVGFQPRTVSLTLPDFKRSRLQ